MSAIAVQPARRSFTFGHAVAGFLSRPGLPLASVLTEDRIGQVFAKHDGLFGRTYTTAIVLWTFMKSSSGRS